MSNNFSIDVITERKQAEQVLRESERQLRLFRHANQHAHDLLAYIDPQGRYVYVSPSLCEHCGYTETELLALNVADLDVEFDLIRFDALIEALQDQTVPPFESVFRRKDGLTFPVEISASLIEFEGVYYVCGIARNITERKRAEEALRRTSAQLKTFINHAPISMAMFDRNMNYLAASGRWFDDHGRGYIDLIGHSHYSIFPDLPDKWKAIHRQGLAGQTLKNDEDLWIQDGGNKRWLRWAVVPWIDETDAVGGIIISTEDITDRKLNDVKLAEQAQQLRENDYRKDEFLAMLAHELRNPLAPIRNAVEIQKLADTEPSRIRWCTNIIDRQLNHLTQLVDNLLDVSRISRGLVELMNETLEIREFIQLAVETNQPLIDARGHKFSMTIPAEPLWVKGDRCRLTQIISNLINNAAKYTEVGGDIHLSVEISMALISIWVSDNGCGFDQAGHSKLFDIFYQTDRNLARSQGGLGIGLPIVKSLVTMHGGDVQAFSAGPAQGSEFVVRLPRFIPTEPSAVFTREQLISMQRKLHILVVDDNTDIADSLILLLEVDGHQVQVAYDGLTALEMAKTQRPDVVLLDIGLPGMDGYSVAKALRQCSELAGLHLIAVTGYGQLKDKELSIAAGFDQHLVKPFDYVTLREMLAHYSHR